MTAVAIEIHPPTLNNRAYNSICVLNLLQGLSNSPQGQYQEALVYFKKNVEFHGRSFGI